MEPVYGIHLGLVVSDGPDPEGRNRIQVWVPHLSNTLFQSINNKLTDSSFNSGKDLNIKDPSDLNVIDPNIVKTLRMTLPWAEYGAPLFGGSSGNYNHAVGGTSTTATSPFPSIPPLYPPSQVPTSENMTLSGIKPSDNQNPNTDITPNPNNTLNPSSLPTGLQPYAQAFIDAGKQYNIDPNFLAAISWEETGGGTSKAFLQGNNAMGISNANGPIYGFSSVEASIFQQAATLSRSNGPYAGATTIGEIGQIYAPAGAENDFLGTNGGWASDVSVLYSKLTGQNPDNLNVTLNQSGQRPVSYLSRNAGGMKEANIGTAGSAVGTFTTPNAGAKVWVFFIGGDVQRPVYFAQAVNTGDVKAFTG